jgi:hypothetical protein
MSPAAWLVAGAANSFGRERGVAAPYGLSAPTESSRPMLFVTNMVGALRSSRNRVSQVARRACRILAVTNASIGRRPIPCPCAVSAANRTLRRREDRDDAVVNLDDGRDGKAGCTSDVVDHAGTHACPGKPL